MISRRVESPIDAMTTHHPRDFSNESFEAFEARLHAAGIGGDSLGWKLREMVFSALYHDPLTWQRVCAGRNALYAIPGGWIAWLYSHHISQRVSKRHVFPPPADHHFLCLSARSNHIQRIAPEASARAAQGSCRIWAANAKTAKALRDAGASHVSTIDLPWAAYLDPDSIAIARNETAAVIHSLPPVDRLAASKLAISFAIYHAALRFWREALRGQPKSVLTTYEKDPVSKAMLAVAEEIGVPERVHWTHGLRHSSQRATIANRLWCLTAADARHFQPKVPPGCLATHRPSPESIHWLNTIGPLPPETLRNPATVHFLFLGSGFEPDCTNEMSLADLRVIAAARHALGSRVQWRFRPHPGNIQRLSDNLSKLGMHDIDFSTRALAEDLAWSHAVGASFSSVAVDIEPTGRPVFWVQAEIRSLYSVDQMIADGFGTHLDAATADAKIRETFHLE